MGTGQLDDQYGGAAGGEFTGAKEGQINSYLASSRPSLRSGRELGWGPGAGLPLQQSRLSMLRRVAIYFRAGRNASAKLTANWF